MKKVFRALTIVTYLCLLSVRVDAGFYTFWTGVTTVTVEKAPIRSGLDDAPIIYVVVKDSRLNVKKFSGHGKGSWIQIEIQENGNLISGYIDVRQTRFHEDVRSGNIKELPLEDWP